MCTRICLHRVLTRFLPFFSRTEAVQFTIYRGSTPWSTPLWLSQSLLLVMYLDSSGQMDGVPVHQIESVTVGFATRELLKRKEKTVMCCVSSVDEAFAQKEPCLFSLQLTDGRTIDLEADTPQLRNEWVDKLKGLIASTSSFVQYHFEVAQYRVSELLKREKDRLSPAAIKKMVDKAQAEKRQGRNQESDKIRQKYAKRQG
jgi:hypothetical protein